MSGTGAKLYGGRWNSPGFAALYTAENISLAVLEILVRTSKENLPPAYCLIKLSVPDNAPAIIIQQSKLKKGWEDDIAYTQWMGDEFLKAGEALMLKVPSAIVTAENNYIINPRHADFKKIKVADADAFSFDKRLFITNE
ncbi:MAG: hypothetical protein RL172_290 [Bacteroidota bacterium]